jgi:hypothetical protein
MNWHYKLEPNGGISLRDLDRPADPITIPAEVLPWLFLNLSSHPAIAASAGARVSACDANDANGVGNSVGGLLPSRGLCRTCGGSDLVG